MGIKVTMDRVGGPEVLTIQDAAEPVPPAGAVRVRNHAIGLNYAEIYFRTGQSGPHSAPSFPAVPGSNAAGIVAAVGDGVADVRIGDRVAYVGSQAYATDTIVPADRVVPLPDDMAFDLAAASFLRGLTAEYLIHRLFRVEPGMTCLVHAAAGGVGQLLAQWLHNIGARVIGTAGGAAKVMTAYAAGCDAVIDYRAEDFRARTLELTDGAGVHIVYDAVGRDVFLPSLDCLRVRGLIASYGAASGPVPPLDIQLLHEKALFVTRPTLRSYIATAEMLRASARCFFEAVAAGKVTPRIDASYDLRDVARAHADLEGRRTTGSAVLIP